jgi:hypothetical protein
MFEEFVVEHGPEEVAHAFGGAIDEVGFVNAIDEDDDAGPAEWFEESLEFGEEFVAVIAAIAGGDRLVVDFAGGEAAEDLSECGGAVVDDADLSGGLTGAPPE